MPTNHHKDNCGDPRIRPIEATHVGEMIRIGEETNLSPWSAQSYLDEIKNPDSIMLRLVSEDTSVAGFIVGRRVIGQDGLGRKDAEIYNIAVVKDKQRTGCGQALFDAFAAQCAENNIANIWLEVRQSNANAIKFYERNGFVPVQTRNHFYDNPREHAVLMRLILK